MENSVLNFKRFMLILILCISNMYAISGVVMNESRIPLEGVSVYLPSKDTTVYTNSDGEFSIITTAVIPGKTIKGSSIGISYKNSTLSLSVPGTVRKEVSLSIFNSRGQKVFGEQLTGHNLSRIPIRDLSNNIYFLQCTVNGKTYVRKFVGSGSFEGRFGEDLSKSKIRDFDTVADTLIFIKDGFYVKSVPVTLEQIDVGTIQLKSAKLSFNRQKMKYKDVVELGDTLIVPISIHSLITNDGDKGFECNRGWISFSSDSQTETIDTMLMYVPTKKSDVGDQKITLMVRNNEAGSNVYYRDTFYVDFEVVLPFVLPRYTIKIGDSLQVPLNLSQLGEHVTVTASHGEVLNGNSFKYISQDGDIGVKTVDFICRLSNGSTKKHTTEIHILPYHKLQVGDEWEFQDIRIFYYGFRKLEVFRQKKVIFQIEEDIDSLRIHYIDSFTSSCFYKKPYLDTSFIDKQVVFKGISSIAKDTSIITFERLLGTNGETMYDATFFKYVNINNYQLDNYVQVDSVPQIPSSAMSYSYGNGLSIIPGIGVVYHDLERGFKSDGGPHRITSQRKMLRFNDQIIFEDTLNLDKLIKEF